MKTTAKKINIYAPITRVDDDKRMVELYAFVNEVVEGEGGIRLLRSAMEDATPDYMKYANIRRMHQPDAIGVAHEAVWDEKGVKLTVEVVDDDAWNKVKRGVYKGGSVGVAPKVMRGLDVTKCIWGETSLVDRPKDPDAQILCFRADGMDDSDEVEVDVVEIDVTLTAAAPRDFASAIAGEALWDEGYDAAWALWDVLCGIATSAAANKEELANQSIQQFAAYIVPMVSGASIKQRGAFLPLPSEWTEEAVTEFKRSFTEALSAGAGRAFTLDGIQRAADPAGDPAPAALAAPAAPIDAEQINRMERAAASIQENLTRLDQIPEVLTRLDGFTNELAGVRTDLSGAIERIVKIEHQPAVLKAPVRYAAQLNNTGDPAPALRTFAVNEGESDIAASRQFLETEIKRVYDEAMAKPEGSKEREAAVVVYNGIKQQLASLA